MIDGKTIMAVILARAGSKGLPNKCVVPVLGKPMIAYTFEHAKAAGTLDGIVLTTDSPRGRIPGRAVRHRGGRSAGGTGQRQGPRR